MYNNCVVVLASLCHRVLQHLHSTHQGLSSMEQRARAIVYWPGMSKDIQETRDRCADCNRNVPSQAATPPIPSTPPSTPFKEIFDYGGHHYLIVGDRLSGWVEVLSSTTGTNLGGSVGLARHLRKLFATFAVPEELSSDGGPEFTASTTENFLCSWNAGHHVSSTGFPQSNRRAKVAVKATKRLLMSTTGPTGSLDHDRFLPAILQLRNTLDRDCNLLSAEVIFGCPFGTHYLLSTAWRNSRTHISHHFGAMHGQPRRKLYVPGYPDCFDRWPLATRCSYRTNKLPIPTSGTGQGWLWNPLGMTNTG